MLKKYLFIYSLLNILKFNLQILLSSTLLSDLHEAIIDNIHLSEIIDCDTGYCPLVTPLKFKQVFVKLLCLNTK